MTIGVTARGLARYNRVSLACLLILSYNVHIDVYTFFHSICPMSVIHNVFWPLEVLSLNLPMIPMLVSHMGHSTRLY